MARYQQNEIEEKLIGLNGWEFKNNALCKNYVFKDFKEAFSFITSIALVSEKLDHHGTITNTYNKVSLEINTHTEQGVTKKDFEWAGLVEKARGGV